MKAYDRKRDQIRNKTPIVCPICNNVVCRASVSKHQRTQNCKSYVKPMENETTPSEPSTADTNIYNKQNRVTIHEDNDTSDDENDNDCYYDGCVEDDSDGDMIGFR